MSLLNFKPTTTPGAEAQQIGEGHWRLSIPAGPAGVYRLAQLDDYAGKTRKDFPWRPPLTLRMQARASAEALPGTWGFGLWNDPFSLAFGFGGGVRRLPALPRAAWFFFASPPNHLSLRDDLPAVGSLAATFNAPRLPAWLLGLGLPFLPLLAWRSTARLLRRAARLAVRQAAAQLPGSAVEWHDYQLDWQPKRVRFSVDDETVFETGEAPGGSLGIVIWIDNQYAAFPPDGRLAYGTLANKESWIEIKDFEIRPGDVELRGS